MVVMFAVPGAVEGVEGGLGRIKHNVIIGTQTIAADDIGEPNGNGLMAHLTVMVTADSGLGRTVFVAVVVAMAVASLRSTFAVAVAPVDRGDTEPTSRMGGGDSNALPFIGVGPLPTQGPVFGRVRTLGASDSNSERDGEAEGDERHDGLAGSRELEQIPGEFAE